MKKILIIDSHGRGAHPDLTPYPFVDFRSELECPEQLDAAAYATVFIHQSNEREADWAKRAFSPRPVFFFSGGKDVPFFRKRHSHMVFLSRTRYRERIEHFLGQYEQTESVEPYLFAAEPDEFPERAQVEGQSPKEPPAGVLYFSLQEEMTGSHCYPIQLTAEEDGIDFTEALLPFSTLAEPRSFFIQETYWSEGDGLELAFRIRLSVSLGGSFCRWPIYLQLDAARLRAYVGKYPKYALLCAAGTHLVDAPHTIDAAGAALKEEELLNILEHLPLRLEPQMDIHDLSNEWGALRLWEGYRMLKQDQTEEPDWARRRRALLDRGYYWYLTSLAALKGRGASHEDLPDGQIDDEGIEQWKAFLESNASLRVLIIDDEIDKGWGDAIREIFGEIPGAAEVVCYPAGQMFNTKQAIHVATTQPWDLVICDLRLTPRDRKTAAMASDPTYRTQFAGFQILRELKAQDPTISFIAFTASSTSWTLHALEDEGADGHWVKENPHHGVSFAYTVQNARGLLTIIERVVRERRERAFLWRLIEDLRVAMVRPTFRSVFSKLGIEDDEVKRRLAAIENLLLRAYAQLSFQPTRYQQDTFRYAPLALAFIHLWGCINEFRHLRFHNNPHGTCRLLNADGQPIAYWSCSGKEARPEPFALDLLQRSSNPKPTIAPCERDASKQGKDDVYLSLLLLHGNRQELEENLNTCRRSRNDLDIIHGDSYRKAAAQISLEKHLIPMAEIIRYILFL